MIRHYLHHQITHALQPSCRGPLDRIHHFFLLTFQLDIKVCFHPGTKLNGHIEGADQSIEYFIPEIKEMENYETLKTLTIKDLLTCDKGQNIFIIPEEDIIVVFTARILDNDISIYYALLRNYLIDYIEIMD
ncbi:hypothetical protein [Bacillus sp. LL01]|uniref:hypothetical protein n=1 Tax=Bacillus sp. LL01 TaxID=1665556 RepID=UPI000FFECDD5|nr:hypothetical protein [Bacillus sp. LL01]